MIPNDHIIDRSPKGCCMLGFTETDREEGLEMNRCRERCRERTVRKNVYIIQALVMRSIEREKLMN